MSFNFISKLNSWDVVLNKQEFEELLKRREKEPENLEIFFDLNRHLCIMGQVARAVNELEEKLNEAPGFVTYNLGSGKGHSVMDVITAFEKANNLSIPYSLGKRRCGDIPVINTNPALAGC